MPEFLEDFNLTLVEAATAAGQTAIDSAGVDMAGYTAVTFFFTVGAITAGAVTSVKAAQSDDNGVTDSWGDLTGTSITIADDDDGQTFGLQIIRPLKRYVRVTISRATQNAVVGEIYALQTGAGVKPITTNVTDAKTFETHHSPAEGTA